MSKLTASLGRTTRTALGHTYNTLTLTTADEQKKRKRKKEKIAKQPPDVLRVRVGCGWDEPDTERSCPLTRT